VPSGGRPRRPSQWTCPRQDALSQVGTQTPLGDDIHLAAQNLLKVQFESRQVQEIPARPEVHQQVEVTARVRLSTPLRAKDSEAAQPVEARETSNLPDSLRHRVQCHTQRRSDHIERDSPIGRPREQLPQQSLPGFLGYPLRPASANQNSPRPAQPATPLAGSPGRLPWKALDARDAQVPIGANAFRPSRPAVETGSLSSAGSLSPSRR
jgi:hypothetical protein